MSDATVRFQPFGQGWETIGAGRYAGVVPQGIEATANEWGSDQLNFVLQTQGGAARPDLLPFCPVELEVDGILCWAGRVKAKPGNDQDISVQCEGWQYHLDDDLYQRMYVMNRMSDAWYGTGGTDYVTAGPRWTDLRAGVNTTDSAYPTAYVVEAKGGMRMAVPVSVTVGTSTIAALVFDAGPDSTIGRFTVTYKGGGNADLNFGYETSTNFDGAGDGEQVIDAAPVATGSTTTSVTPANARRYLRLRIRNTSGAPSVGTSTSWVRVLDVICYRSTAYESGNASILKADTVVKDALTFAPLLNQSVTSITAGTFNLAEYTSDGHQTPRAVIESVNTFERYDMKIGGPDLKTLIYRAKPTTPLFEVGQRAGARFSDDSSTGEDIFNQVIVTGSDAQDRNVQVTRTQTGTIVDRQGFDRTRVLQVRSPLTTSIANQIGDLWLLDHRTVPLAGKLTGTGAFVRTVTGGASVPPASLLLQAGEMIRLAHRRDPDTGAQGRDGRIVGVSYRPDGDSLVIDIDDRRSSFDRVLAQREAGTR